MERERLAKIIYEQLPNGSKHLVAYDSWEAPEPVSWEQAKREGGDIVKRVYETVDKIMRTD